MNQDNLNTELGENRTSGVEGYTSAQLRAMYFAQLEAECVNDELSEEQAITELETMEMEVTNFYADRFGVVLSPADRKEHVGVATGKLGFIEMCYEKALAMPDLLPARLSPERFAEDIGCFKADLRMVDQAGRLLRLAGDRALISGSRAYHNALSFYRAVKDAVASRVEGAEVILKALSAFFRNNRHRDKNGLTESEIERDARSLLHGTKSGRLTIENTMPQTIPGVRRVVDDVDGEHRESEV